MNTKKIILILGIVIIIGIAAFIILSPKNAPTDTPNSGFSIRNFFPFGNSEDIISSEQNIEGEGNASPEIPTVSGPNEILPRLRKISSAPVAGAVMLSQGTTTIVRFVQKDTGNVYEARSDSAQIQRLTNTTIAKINRAFWLPTGEGFLAQKASENGFIETSYIRLRKSPATTSNELLLPYEPVISSLPSGITEITPSPDGKKIFYYTSEGGTKGFLSDPDGTKATSIYESGVSEWVLNWFSSSSIFLTTKASYASQGFGYLLNPSNKTLSRVFGEITGASALMRSDGKFVLVSAGGSVPRLLSVDISTQKSRLSNIETLSEKCVWGEPGKLIIICGVPKSFPKGNYPDSWYGGRVATSDLLELIDLENDSVLILSDPKEDVGENIDVDKVISSKNGDFISFVNKPDQSLWLFEI